MRRAHFENAAVQILNRLSTGFSGVKFESTRLKMRFSKGWSPSFRELETVANSQLSLEQQDHWLFRENAADA
jgi:hypothetical protein